MPTLTKPAVEAVLQQIVDPNSQTDLLTAKSVKAIDIDGDKLAVQIELGYPADGYLATLEQQVADKLKSLANDVSVAVSWKVMARSVQPGVKAFDNIKNVIAIASGKGGVGKSTTTVNLALALVKEGAKVGVLDADIYGPSQPRMLGIEGRPESVDGKTMEPMRAYGVEAMSIGFLIDEESPMIWRGPMVTQALEQLLRDTNWGELDYLLIDMPPGTGDVQLTLSQKIPVSGAVIVTTPQDIALLDARKGLKMFEKVNVKVLGVVENMSTHICSNCGHEEHIFGAGGGLQMAQDYSIDLLGSLPLDINIRQSVDSGKPSVVADADGAAAQAYGGIARKVAAKLALQAKDYSSKFPNIVIQNT
ncbi:MAG TPA: iron-sulfur cluster carrier protein ApbC [Candidatus Tenderia electrophaga]|uniref:Iron-sulfur cluster carrier protein n=1 Tax=Candidatus Tenderia electrophaga TaxID=1748243 RepID=A0A832N4L3_9GAMM|nr:iron-sulfur cluster carrier protein ApbC [Candidatus Tenderia electrophaga]